MADEIKYLQDNHTHALVKLPKDKRECRTNGFTVSRLRNIAHNQARKKYWL